MTDSDIYILIFLYACIWHFVGFFIVMFVSESRFFQTLDRYMEARWNRECLASGIAGCICLPVVAVIGGIYILYQKTLTWLEDRTEVLLEEKRRRK